MYKKQLLLTLFSFACVSTQGATDPDSALEYTNLSLKQNISDKDQVKPEQPYQRASPSWVEDVKNHPILFSLTPLLVILTMIIGYMMGIMDELHRDRLHVPLILSLIAAIPSLWQIKEGVSTQERTYTPPFTTRLWRSFRFLASSTWTFVPWMILALKEYNLPFLTDVTNPTSLDVFLVFIVFPCVSSLILYGITLGVDYFFLQKKEIPEMLPPDKKTLDKKAA